MKKLIAVFLTILCCILAAPAAGAADCAFDPEALRINPYGGAETDLDTIRCCPSDEGYFLYLPGGTDPDAAVVYFQSEAALTLDGAELLSGGSAAGFTEGVHSLCCGSDSWQLTVCVSADLPAVFLRTESGSLDYIHADKENKEPGDIRIYEDGSMTLDKALKQIKGRGNSTWSYPKKPYNIKFDKKTDLFGMGKAKKWTLLANYIDLSLLHNPYGWELSSVLGLCYTGEYRLVDLYVNGDYLGNYTVCESVEVGENRVEIEDLEKANENANPELDIETLPRGGTGPNNSVQRADVKGSRKWIQIPEDPADLTGGYLLEYDYQDRYNKELCGFVTSNGQPVVLKAPEYASEAEVNYIADLMEEAGQALYSPTGYNEAGRYYDEYYDLDSLAAAYILQEISMNFDAGFSSFFAFKPAGESKIYFGPVWDMDNAFASPYVQFDVPLTTTELWWANQMAYNGIPSILAAACRHEDFRALVREKWAALREDGTFEAVQGRIAALADSLQKSGGMNGVRWNFYDTADYETAAARWQEEAALCMAFTEARIETLDTGFSEEGAYLYYDMNGASDGRWASVSPIRRIGETLIVRSITENGNVIPPEGRLFHSWNTEPDGSGDQYLPGDELVLESEETVLYAVWKTQYEINKENGVNPFEDVPEGKYYTAAVLWAYYHEPQITSGADETHFAPNAPCTREQVMTFLYAAADRPGHQQSESPFTDVKPGKYYYNPVLWAVEKGITGGVGGGKFGVGLSCTREQVMTFLWAAAGRPLPENGETPFSDVDPGAYYAKAVAWAVEQKLTGGVGDGRFGVGEPCTRGQVVIFLYSIYGKGE